LTKALEPLDVRGKQSRTSVERLADGFGTRVRTMSMIEVLERRGALSARQARVGARVYQAYVLGVCGAQDSEASGNGSDPGGYRDAQLNSLQEYRELRDAVGGRLWSVVFAVCCEDWSPSRWANERGGGMDPKGANALLRIALDMAADAFGEV
jgi:hypothetical protein